MAATKATKSIARQLYQEGHNALFISQRCGVNRRTAQRWVKAFEQEKVIVHGEENLADPNTPSVEILPALEAVANTEQNKSVELVMTSRSAIRLINLAESAVATVERVLDNPDSSDISKLRAAQLAGDWLGFKDNGGSVIQKVSNKLGLEFSLENSQSEEITFTPTMVISARKRERKVQEARKKMKQKDVAIWKAQEKLVKTYRSPDDVIFLETEPEINWMYFLPVLAENRGLNAALRLMTHLIDYKYIVREEAEIFIEYYGHLPQT